MSSCLVVPRRGKSGHGRGSPRGWIRRLRSGPRGRAENCHGRPGRISSESVRRHWRTAAADDLPGNGSQPVLGPADPHSRGWRVMHRISRTLTLPRLHVWSPAGGVEADDAMEIEGSTALGSKWRKHMRTPGLWRLRGTAIPLLATPRAANRSIVSWQRSRRATPSRWPSRIGSTGRMRRGARVSSFRPRQTTRHRRADNRHG